MAGNRHPDDLKMRQLIAYAAFKAQRHPRFGAVKLNKIPFLVDFAAYGRYGASVTGQTYVKREFGACAKRYVEFRDSLIEEGICVLQTEPIEDGRTLKRLICTSEPDFSALTGREVALIDQYIEMAAEMSSAEVGDFTHVFAKPWDKYDLGEEIPYEVGPVRLSNPTSEDQKFAAALTASTPNCFAPA